ncbi:MAG: hypothetical protein R2942_00095 [Ignavibacteria bacterium]
MEEQLKIVITGTRIPGKIIDIPFQFSESIKRTTHRNQIERCNE